MSVEIEGIKGYEYQYLATIYISLLYIEKDSIEIYIEDTEDVRFVFEGEGEKKEIFLQSKKHNANISFKDICLWLSHFGERQSNVFLLSRISKENCWAVFFSNGRCEDKVLQHLRCKEFEDGNGGTFDCQYIADIRQVLLRQYKEETLLNIQRKSSIKTFLDNCSNQQMRGILKKVSLVEQLSYEKLMKQITELLNKKFVVRTASIDYSIKLLDECVRNGRDTGGDIAPDILKILKQFSQKILPDNLDYMEVPNQEKYISVLEKCNVLLFTGVPFSGKTTVAKSIAQVYAQYGYEVKQTSDFDGDNGALSFLNSYTDDKRLLLFEDPFGSIQLKPDRIECVQKIFKLITERTSFDRKIIITTRKDILLTAFGRLKIVECNIAGNCWFDQTLQETNFVFEFWKKLYGCSQQSLECFASIKDYIDKEESGVFLEVGEICNLKTIYSSIDELKKISIKKIILDARVSSKIIMDKIKSEGSDSIRAFISLGFCCNTIRSVSIEDLAYVLSCAEETPALILRDKNRARCISVGGKKTTLPSFPQYHEKYKIKTNILSLLQQFEKQGYIYRNKLSKEIYFAHPIFCYASKLLLLDDIENQWENDETLLLARHAISTLNKNVNICALDILWYVIESDCVIKNIMLELMLKTLNSIFPATKDKAIILLEKYFKALSCEQQDVLIRAIKDYDYEKYLLWSNNEPFINPNNEIELEWGFESFFMRKSPASVDEIKKIETKQNASPKLIFDILNSEIADDLSLDLLNILMTYDESIIREKAIYLIFKNYGKNLNNLGEYLIGYDNCNVIFALLRGALESWFTYKKIDKDLLIEYFLLQLQRISVVMQAQNFLETFGDDYHTKSLNWDKYSKDQTTELWVIWCIVFTEFFLRIPPKYLQIDEAHMEYTMQQAVKYVENPQYLLKLFFAWNTWLNNTRCPSDYGMCIMENVLRYIPIELIDRIQLFTEMISVKDTSIITSHIKHIVDNWEYVGQSEKCKVAELFLSDRNDIVWIQAVAITRKCVPLEVEKYIFTYGIFSKPVDEIIEILRETHLLEYCLNVHCGYPQPLWWNGYHHSNYKVWDAIILEILSGDILDRSYDISLREFVDCEYNCEQRFIKKSEEVWRIILANKKKREHAFRWLLKVSATQVQTNKVLWDNYFSACSFEEAEIANEEIANFIEPLEYHQDGDDGILDLFDSSIILDHVYPLIESDMLVRQVCELVIIFEQNTPEFAKASGQEKSYQMLKTAIETLYSQNPPRMQLTNVIVKRTMRKIGLLSKELDEILEKRRCDLIDIACEKEKQLNDHYDLANWNSIKK